MNIENSTQIIDRIIQDKNVTIEEIKWKLDRAKEAYDKFQDQYNAEIESLGRLTKEFSYLKSLSSGK